MSRYLRDPELRIVPFSISGTEKILPISDLRLQPSTIRLVIGEPILAADLLNKFKGKDRSQRIMDYIGSKIALKLPLEYQGYYSVKKIEQRVNGSADLIAAE